MLKVLFILFHVVFNEPEYCTKCEFPKEVTSELADDFGRAEALLGRFRAKYNTLYVSRLQKPFLRTRAGEDRRIKMISNDQKTYRIVRCTVRQVPKLFVRWSRKGKDAVDAQTIKSLSKHTHCPDTSFQEFQ